jgi:hypothetical protein
MADFSTSARAPCGTDHRIWYVDGRFHHLSGRGSARYGGRAFDRNGTGIRQTARARENLEATGLADLVEIRVDDARETLADVRDEIDLVLLDGAFSLYLPVLKLLEPYLKPATPILAENALGQG